MLSPGSLLNFDWFRTEEGREILGCLLYRNGQKRRTFGLLERPTFPPSLTPEDVKYKIFVVGKSGVGKTSTVAKLSGNEIPAVHSETPGIQTSTMFWPAKISQLNKIVLFEIKLWDAGENALRKFDHIQAACTNKVDAILFLFSFVDKSSFEEIPQLMTRLTNPDDGICKLVIGTKFDQHAHSEITQRDIRDFENNWKIPILKIRNVSDYHPTGSRNELSEIIPLMNIICEHLWHRDVKTATRTSSDSQIRSTDTRTSSDSQIAFY
ncbi:ciliogenesis and planar polarity effector 2-like [Gigantopelta aegis]|uniref:ciliogenesis and planar polarity effector 2-like n=1 Tax=Gigantopelta aegis TaxID=1735272 RepID=UPI001B88E75A|nr:ciliogenesis and planar polarity effector 2-like [Gigantopelta aegis]